MSIKRAVKNDPAAALKGEAGPPGRPGTTGIAGPQGKPGDKGPPGDKGLLGDKGSLGDKGKTGDKGLTGDKGPLGDKGKTGDKGPPGEKGKTGDKGPLGDKGPVGEKGQGPEGRRGPEGVKGQPGDKGETGDKGNVGDKGPRGDQGERGASGTVVIASAPRLPVRSASHVYLLDDEGPTFKNLAADRDHLTTAPGTLLLSQDSNLFARGATAVRFAGRDPSHGLLSKNASFVPEDGASVDLIFEAHGSGSTYRWIFEATSAEGATFPSAISIAEFPGQIRVQLLYKGKIAAHATLASPIALGKRTHLGVRINKAARTLDLLVNGMLEASAAFSGDVIGPFTSIAVGRSVGGDHPSFRGLIGEVRLSPRPESDSYFQEAARSMGLL